MKAKHMPFTDCCLISNKTKITIGLSMHLHKLRDAQSIETEALDYLLDLEDFLSPEELYYFL